MTAQLLRQLSDNLGPYAFEISLAIIFVLWLFFFLKYHVFKLLPFNRELMQFCQFLDGLGNAKEENETKISNYFLSKKQKSLLAQAWEDYTSNKSVDADLKNYFNEDTLLGGSLSHSKAGSVSSFIMSTGLLLSFICLYAGVGDLSAALSQQTVVISVFNEVILIAVLTILLSVIYNRMDKSLFDQAESVVYEAQKLLSRKLISSQEHNQIDRIAISIDNMANSLASYAQYTAEIQRNGMHQLVDSFLSSLNSEMNGQFTELGRSLEALSATNSQSVTQTEALVKELVKGTENQQYINKATEQIITSIAQYQEQISISSQSLANSLQDLQQISDTLSGIVAFSRDAMESIMQEREALSGEYNRYMQGIQDMIQKYQKETSIELERVMNRFAEISGKTFANLEGSINKSMDIWTSSNKSMLQNLEEQSRGLISVSREIAARLNELNAGLKETMKQFTDTVENGTVKTLSEFDNGLGEITERLSRTITEIRDSIDDLPAVIESLKQHIS